MQGDLEEAERFSRESMQLARRGIGESSPFAVTLFNLAEFLRLQGRHQEAEPMYREVRLCVISIGGSALRCICMCACTGPPIPLLTS